MNVRMWGAAITRMPKVTNEEWLSLDVVSRFLIASRAAVLWLTLGSCLLAGGLAAREGKFNLHLWLATTLGLLFAHATNNFLNDATDHWKGTDKGDYVRSLYGVQPLEQGVMTKREFAVYSAIPAAIALACGAYLLHERSGLVLRLFGAGIFFVLFYTFPLKYYGLGEVAVILVWGPLMVGGGYYVVTGEWSWMVALVGTVYALGPTQVIFGKHIDKLQADTGKHIHTLPVIIGERASKIGVLAVMTTQYACVIALIATGYLSAIFLASFLSIGTFIGCWRVYTSPRPKEKPKSKMAIMWPIWLAAWSFLHSCRFGLFFLIALAVELVFPSIRAWHPL
jgi:1,4-dihydroxy-2-naphthoate polyprenyltransferase